MELYRKMAVKQREESGEKKPSKTREKRKSSQKPRKKNQQIGTRSRRQR